MAIPLLQGKHTTTVVVGLSFVGPALLCVFFIFPNKQTTEMSRSSPAPPSHSMMRTVSDDFHADSSSSESTAADALSWELTVTRAAVLEDQLHAAKQRNLEHEIENAHWAQVHRHVTSVQRGQPALLDVNATSMSRQKCSCKEDGVVEGFHNISCLSTHGNTIEVFCEKEKERSIEALSFEQVAFFIFSTPSYWDDRVKPALDTWGKGLPNMYLIMDRKAIARNGTFMTEGCKSLPAETGTHVEEFDCSGAGGHHLVIVDCAGEVPTAKD